jgi:pathogenesis-related protein 1
MKSDCLTLGLAIALIGISSNTYAAPNFIYGEQAELVNAHNIWRTQVHVPLLKWSTTISETAQSHADSLKSSRNCKPSHSATDLGENLFWASPTDYSDGSSEVQAISPTQVAEYWGSEKVDYDDSTNNCATGKMCGHYTQMVWKTTAEIGCGRAICKDNSQIWVCNYRPAGNIMGEHPYK